MVSALQAPCCPGSDVWHGEQLDITKPRDYVFDHMIPRSRGGDNSLDNLGLCTKQANMAKSDLTPEEFIQFCKKVLEYNGYTVNK